MNDINVVTINGRLTKNCEERTTQSGTSVTRFSIANGYSRKDGDEWKNETNYFDVVMLGKAGMSQYLVKGRQVSIQGELRQSRWEDQNGNPRSRVEIVVCSIQLLAEPKQEGSQQQTQAQTQARPQAQKPAPAPAKTEDQVIDEITAEVFPDKDVDDDVPF